MHTAHATTTTVHKVLLVDDHPLVCNMLTALINAQGNLMVCGVAGSLDEAIAATDCHHPDIAIVDLSLAHGNGLTLIQTVKPKAPNLKFIVFSAHETSVFSRRSRDIGAHGYINKREAPEKIIDAINSVIEGGAWFTDLPGHSSPLDALSNRELEILELVGMGLSNAAIARQLNRSVKTIESHRENLKHKLGLKSSPELLRYAMQWLLDQG